MFFDKSDNYPGVFSLTHLLYIIGMLAVLALLIFIVIKLIKGKKSERWFIRILGIIHLVFIIANRFFNTYYKVEIAHLSDYSWWTLLPHTFCGLSSFLVSLLAIFGKKDSKLWHFVMYFSMFGAIATMAYPDCLIHQTFLDIRTLTCLFHHTMIIYICVIIAILGWYKPDFKYWYYYPLGYIMVMFIGLLEKEILHFPEAMNIGEPLISSLPVLTSWYFIFFVSSAAVILFMFIYSRRKKNASKKNS